MVELVSRAAPKCQPRRAIDDEPWLSPADVQPESEPAAAIDATDPSRSSATHPPRATPIPPASSAWRRAQSGSGGAAVAFARSSRRRVAASHFGGRSRPRSLRSTIMVAPFRVRSSDPASAYLREGLLDLLASRIAEPRRSAPRSGARAPGVEGCGLPGDSAVSADSRGASCARSRTRAKS